MKFLHLRIIWKSLAGILITGIILMLFSSCSEQKDKSSKDLRSGKWRAWLDSPGGELPFLFDIVHDSLMHIYIYNADEVIDVTDIRIEGDSLIAKMPVFDSEIRAKIIGGDSLEGVFKNNARKDHRVLSLHGHAGDDKRFQEKTKSNRANFDGRWEVKFVHEKVDTSLAIAEFRQNGAHLEGTFLTPTGDYRYLEGMVTGNRMFLSTFDGAHSFLFKAVLKKKNGRDILEGEFWSGAHWYETWTARRNEDAKLPPADSLTYLKKGYENISLSLNNPEGKPVSLSNPPYKGNPVVLQIMGTWCPNCVDESVFLRDWLREHPESDLQVLGLAFELRNDSSKAAGNIRRYRQRLKIPWEIVFAGQAGENASEVLPMLNKIMSYPTTVFIDRKGKVRRIITGFSGPATGQNYQDFRKDFSTFVERLDKGDF